VLHSTPSIVLSFGEPWISQPRRKIPLQTLLWLAFAFIPEVVGSLTLFLFAPSPLRPPCARNLEEQTIETCKVLGRSQACAFSLHHHSRASGTLHSLEAFTVPALPTYHQVARLCPSKPRWEADPDLSELRGQRSPSGTAKIYSAPKPEALPPAGCPEWPHRPPDRVVVNPLSA
jgi:hypothetical protein